MDGRPHRRYKALAGRWSELSSLKLESFFLKFGTTFTLSHIQKKGIKCTKEEEIRGADMYRILEKLLFLLHPSLLEPYFYGPQGQN